MKKANIWKVASLIFLLIAGAVTVIVYCGLFINKPIRLTDIVSLAAYYILYNHAIEKSLIYILIFGGIIIYTVFYSFIRHRTSSVSLQADSDDDSSKSLGKYDIVFFVASITAFLIEFTVFGRTDQWGIALLALIFLLADRKNICIGLCTYILAGYSFFGLYRLYVFLGGLRLFDTKIVSIMALGISVIPMLIKERAQIYMRLSSLFCLICPLNLLVFLTDKYSLNGVILRVSVPGIVRITVYILIAIFVILPFIRYIKKRFTFSSINEVITIGACIAIMLCNRFDGTGAVMSEDMRHPFEDIIGFQQIFELKQIPFEEYIPNSGLYSVIHGAFAYIFGNGGMFSEYYISTNIFYLFVIILVVALLRGVTDGAFALLLSLIFYVPSYNRYCFLLPIVLMLINPKMIKNRRRWLIAFFISSMLHGLYYPALGFSVLMAFVPLGIYQLFWYIKSGDLKLEFKTLNFWFSVCISALLFVILLRPLLGMAKHVFIYSEQGGMADGYSRFGSNCPQWLFPYISNIGLRQSLWYVITFLVLACIVWFPAILLLEKAKKDGENRVLDIKNKEEILCLLALLILPCVSYTYSTITMDPGSLYSRSLGIIFTMITCLSVFIFKDKVKGVGVFLFILLVSFSALFSYEKTRNARTQITLAPCYYVPDNYILVENTAIPKLGRGFISAYLYSNLTNAMEAVTEAGPFDSYMNVPGSFGYTYLLNKKGAGYIEIYEVKGLSRTEEVIEAARKSHCLIGYPSAKRIEEYYFTKWLLVSGEYEYDNEIGYFIPSAGEADTSISNKRYTCVDSNTGIRFVDPEPCDLLTLPALWGNSFDALAGRFHESNAIILMEKTDEELSILFDKNIRGEEADFLYVEFDDSDSAVEYNPDSKYLFRTTVNPNKNLVISYSDDNDNTHTMTCTLSNGKLLIPLGEGYGWLLNSHDKVGIKSEDYTQGISLRLPDIKTAKLLYIDTPGMN